MLNRVKIFIVKHRLTRWGFFLLALLFVIVLLFPLFWMFRISISPRPELFEIPPKWIPERINPKGYHSILAEGNFLRYYLNSIIVAIATVFICLFAGILAAYSFSRFEYPARKTLMVITLSAQMFPWALLIISLYIFFLKLRLLDTYWALILAHTTFALPLTLWIVKGYFDTIPRELEESAYMDGCMRTRALLTIIVPLSAPGILAAAIYIFIFSWNDFLFGLTLTSSDNMRILAPGIALAFIGQYEYRWIEMMASSIAVMLPIVIAFLFLQRYFIEGLTAGAIKE